MCKFAKEIWKMEMHPYQGGNIKWFSCTAPCRLLAPLLYSGRTSDRYLKFCMCLSFLKLYLESFEPFWLANYKYIERVT